MRLRNSNLIEQGRVNIKKFVKSLLNVNNETLLNTKKREIVN